MNMKLSFQILMISVLVFLAGCAKDLEPTGLSDADIIQMIQSAEKIEVSISDLPSQSQTVVEEDYYEYMDVSTNKASGLGYEVTLAGMGYRVGSRNEVYFNLEGRKLDPYDWGNKRGWDREDYERDFDDKGGWKCFELVFPITFDMPDGSAITVASNDRDGWVEIKSWYDSNPGADQRPTMQYPVVIFYEDESITLSSAEELRGAYSRCHSGRDGNEWGRKRECFDLVYPVTFTLPDGSSMDVVNDEENGWDELKNWYDENPGYEEVMPELNFPVDIVYAIETGDSTVTIDTEEEMYLAKRECWGKWGEDEESEEECFVFVFPITYIMPDGSTLTISEEEDWYNLRAWYEENGESEEEPLLQFPVDISYETEDGQSTVTVNSEEEMRVVEEACNDD